MTTSVPAPRTPGMPASPAPFTAREFDAMLDRLVIAWPAGGEPSIGPTDDPGAELVAAFIADVLDDSPDLVRLLWARFADVPEVADGVKVVPVASVKGALRNAAKAGRWGRS